MESLPVYPVYPQINMAIPIGENRSTEDGKGVPYFDGSIAMGPWEWGMDIHNAQPF